MQVGRLFGPFVGPAMLRLMYQLLAHVPCPWFGKFQENGDVIGLEGAV